MAMAGNHGRVEAAVSDMSAVIVDGRKKQVPGSVVEL